VKRILAGVTALLLLAGSLALQAAPTEEERIEEVIAAVIEALRTSDYSAMGRHYAPEATVVPGDYSPAVSGWSNIEPGFTASHADFTNLELLREDTRIVRRGKVAWASYRWRLAGIRGKQMVQAQGHTTLVLEKRGGHWLILHNHTSLVPLRSEAPPAAPPQP